ncbi:MULTISPECIES: biotin/lipoate A/B protein ligase family protein [unclassified Hydrogenobaculum]|uniref:lipoate--protein ligase family protein n=1 Tax=unclassified Hydrogenobaculum TaxID=2622382 RepID=UPI0001C52ADE|nr:MULTISPECIES: biotin/lipoate A/B protein ligase family protein [unclassified Hydrogenobaculum]AEF19077.1 biotin/lipoate A/B protein ligase [Hydrogenobaculum sp. 3684]AEG46367.1 biotin/lipoate A/B protein ligase [Hydrogenobaculum sp. SHO]AGG15010.1 biotin/lipoate A/B protein ligase [Hydrogenobaculum sp. HO]AGH93307.1 lipoate-protein ligase A [Hydrogenobaculum sp. SN]
MGKDGKRYLIVFVVPYLKATTSVALFHALAKKQIECIVITEPSDTCVSLGYFDNANRFLDFNYCKTNNIPIIRRYTGGGTVLLHPGQIFYQFIFSKSNKTIPFKMENVYKYFSNIIIEVYKSLGINAFYKPIADITLNDKKISGQGAGDIENMLVFVGNILMDFDFDMMANIISYVKDKKSFKELLEKNITTLRKEGLNLSKDSIINAFIDVLKDRFGHIEISVLPEYIWDLSKKIEIELTSYDVITEDTGKEHKVFKIKENYFIDPKTLERVIL